MSNGNDNMKKTATVFSGLVFSFPLRLVITGASYAVVRFKLPPSEIGPFISILSNSMQITFILGILSINILIWCKVQGNIIRYISIIINWLYLIIHLTMLIMIYSSDDIKGNLSAYYWAMMIAGYLSGASGTCVLSVNGEYATIFTTTVPLSGMLMSGCNWIILKRISAISDYETSYRIINYQIIIYIIMILITSILWTILFNVNADTNDSTTGNTTIVTMASIFGIFVSVCHWIILKYENGLLKYETSYKIINYQIIIYIIMILITSIIWLLGFNGNAASAAKLVATRTDSSGDIESGTGGGFKSSGSGGTGSEAGGSGTGSSVTTPSVKSSGSSSPSSTSSSSSSTEVPSSTTSESGGEVGADSPDTSSGNSGNPTTPTTTTTTSSSTSTGSSGSTPTIEPSNTIEITISGSTINATKDASEFSNGKYKYSITDADQQKELLDPKTINQLKFDDKELKFSNEAKLPKSDGGTNDGVKDITIYTCGDSDKKPILIQFSATIGKSTRYYFYKLKDNNEWKNEKLECTSISHQVDDNRIEYYETFCDGAFPPYNTEYGKQKCSEQK
ncbi:Tpr related protein, putative [Babesia microti strain RI]|uniref:Tpr related protein, putative n=1 Tax=Babesia microti (strain RI) TaxID=1133968 RepID=I7IQR8_BABMR|nr:Tpr related protein, putative [Babesia microti strain RI]CCF74000.1 Tpr related protein, putative [Babesia microti strain RI]|eukprot:XP_012648609.1 Tpr related protein, putative [Babesia microti strain RI]